MAAIVLVEDNVELRRSLIDCLTVMGHAAHGVGSAVELYQLLAQRHFDVAVVDINLPYYDGYSVASYLAENTDLGIIIASVRDALEDRVRGYKVGADIYMTKPVDPEELSAAIEGLLTKKKSASVKTARMWTYSPQTMTMTAPNGRIVHLTKREMLFIGELASRSGASTPRRAVLDALGDDDVAKSHHNLDTLVSRFRSKVKARTGLAAPLVTIQSGGFSLEGPFRQSETAERAAR